MAADNTANEATAIGQSVGEGALSGAQKGWEDSQSDLAQSAEDTGQAVAHAGAEFGDHVVKALQTIIDDAIQSVGAKLDQVGDSLPFPLSMLVPTMLALAHQVEAQIEKQADAAIEAADQALMAKAGAACAVLKADLDKFIKPVQG